MAKVYGLVVFIFLVIKIIRDFSFILIFCTFSSAYQGLLTYKFNKEHKIALNKGYN